MPTNPHHNPETERRLLSSLTFGPEEVHAAVRDGLCADAFFDATHRTFFNAIATAAAEDRATDVVTVWRRLSGMTGDASPRAMEAFATLDGLEPTCARRARLVADVLGLWRQRKLVAALTAATEAASLPAQTWGDVWEAAEPHIRAAQEAGSSNVARTVADMAQVAHDRLTHGDKRAVVHTGLRGWDIDASVLRAGELVVVAARPGAGKTALALQMAGYNARNGGGSTAFFSLEMTGEELVLRMAASAAGFDGLRNNARRAAAALEIGKLKALQIYDGAAVASIAQIEARARLLANAPAGLRAVFVDYLQLIAPPAETRREHRERQVAEMSRRFKLMAGELGCPVVLLAQLNRESEKDSRRPKLSDLRESGAIEQDADRVWFLYQPKEVAAARVADDSSVITVALYQAKCRNGRPGIETLLEFNRPLFSFTPAA